MVLTIDVAHLSEFFLCGLFNRICTEYTVPNSLGVGLTFAKQVLVGRVSRDSLCQLTIKMWLHDCVQSSRIRQEPTSQFHRARW
jgi:hypothetical protein